MTINRECLDIEADYAVPKAAIVTDEMTSKDIEEASILPSYPLESTEMYNDVVELDVLPEGTDTLRRALKSI